MTRGALLKSIMVSLCICGSYIFADQGPDSASNEDIALKGEVIYKKRCSGCHGQDGSVKAFGISRELVILTPKELPERLKSFTDKRFQGVASAAGTMHKQVMALNRQEYDAVLYYVLNHILPKTP